MAKDINVELLAALSKPALVPVWLFRLYGPFGDHYFCSQATAAYNGHTWSHTNLSVRGPSVRAGAGAEATVELEQQAAIVTAVIEDTWAGTIGELYLSYYDGDKIVTPKLLLSGDISSVSMGNKTVSMQLTAGGNRKSVTPWITIAPPLFNWLTPRGTLLVWGSEAVIIDR